MKYLAASVPRTMRAARLAHLRGDAILGCWFVKSGGGNQVFDVIMLPEAEFLKAKNQLATPAMGASLQPGNVQPPYIPKDTREIEAPDATSAAAHFRQVFNLPG